MSQPNSAGKKEVPYKGRLTLSAARSDSSSNRRGNYSLSTLDTYFVPGANSGSRKRVWGSSESSSQKEESGSYSKDCSAHSSKKVCTQLHSDSHSQSDFGIGNMSGFQVKNGVNPKIKGPLEAGAVNNVSKPKQAKKLVIKNLKGCLCVYTHCMYVQYSLLKKYPGQYILHAFHLVPSSCKYTM